MKRILNLVLGALLATMTCTPLSVIASATDGRHFTDEQIATMCDEFYATSSHTAGGRKIRQGEWFRQINLQLNTDFTADFTAADINKMLQIACAKYNPRVIELTLSVRKIPGLMLDFHADSLQQLDLLITPDGSNADRAGKCVANFFKIPVADRKNLLMYVKALNLSKLNMYCIYTYKHNLGVAEVIHYAIDGLRGHVAEGGCVKVNCQRYIALDFPTKNLPKLHSINLPILNLPRRPIHIINEEPSTIAWLTKKEENKSKRASGLAAHAASHEGRAKTAYGKAFVAWHHGTTAEERAAGKKQYLELIQADRDREGIASDHEKIAFERMSTLWTESD